MILAGLIRRQNDPFMSRGRFISLKSLKIAIAEDSKLIGDVLNRTLSRIEGFRVVGVAENGVEALELVQKYEPHVLILDILMPFKDGIEVLGELRAANEDIVIVMFTADATTYAKKACLALGADYYLDKSEVGELIEICNLHLLAL